MRHVIIDTDIGTDVDDLLALVFIAKAPACLEGITTVHGDTLLPRPCTVTERNINVVRTRPAPNFKAYLLKCILCDLRDLCVSSTS